MRRYDEFVLVGLDGITRKLGYVIIFIHPMVLFTKIDMCRAERLVTREDVRMCNREGSACCDNN